MLYHLVLTKPRADLSDEKRKQFFRAFDRAISDIPTIRRVRTGVRVRHGALYEAIAPDAADVLAIMEFDDLEGLKAYLQHPAHAELGDLFWKISETTMVYDFETGGAELLRTLA